MAHLVRVIISVTSIDSARRFYEDLLRLPVRYRASQLLSLDLAGTELLLHERPTTPSDSSVSIAVATSGVAGLVERWRGLGGVVVDELAEQPWGERMAVVRDADGHVVCLVEAP